MKIEHCCFNTSMECVKSFRIHIPIAVKCSMGCIYCNYINDNNVTAENVRPGTANKIVKIDEIKDYLEEKLKIFPQTHIIGVSGPGDPLENLEELNCLLDLIKDSNTEGRLLKLCICTNGKKRGKEIDDLWKRDELEYVSFTLNTLKEEKAVELYRSITSLEGAGDLISSQLHNIEKLKEYGKKVKVNTVYIDKINDCDIEEMIDSLIPLGVDCFNIMPRRAINSSEKKYLCDIEKMNELIVLLRKKGVPILYHCNQCSADYCGDFVVN